MRTPAPSETTGSAVSRRFVLKAGALVGGGCLLGIQVSAANAAASDETGSSGVFAPNAFIRIASDGQVTLIMPQAEMGQGIYTAHAMILAEELDADFARVAVEASPPSDALYGNPVFGLQATGNSNSVRAFWMPLRKAGAAAREMLVSAAAATWSVNPSECRVESHQVIHDATGRKLDYGELAAPAALVTPPSDPPLKPVKDFRLIGKPLKRLDTPGKVNGKVVYGIDTLPEGVKFATLAACPVFGGKVGRVDDSKTKSIPGLRQVLVFDDFVATVGDHTWAALQALAALEIVWDGGPSATVDSGELWDRIRTASEQPGAVAKSVGDVAAALR